MDTDTIAIKGIRDGLMVTLGDGPLEALLEALKGRLDDQGEFFRGGRVALVAGRRQLTGTELETMGDLFAESGMTLWAVLTEDPETEAAARALKLGTRLPGSGADLAGAAPSTGRAEERRPLPETTPMVPQPDRAEGLLVRGALRSGRVVTHQGHVVVIGDVNPGAEIVAGGDVVVWGKLRGLVHAGAFGDRSAVVCALELVPTQLRIADLITVSPAGPREAEPIPEMASIKDGQIVAESWSPGYRAQR